MDNCIGEKNRALFFCYLIFEVCQLGLAVLLMRSNYAEWQAHYWLGLVFAVALMLAVLLTGLLIFHTYLMVKGITTWEYFSWQNITYLSKIPAYTNPFSLSIWENIKVYWLSSFKKQPHIWVPY
jgi:palmitoyltransferase